MRLPRREKGTEVTVDDEWRPRNEDCDAAPSCEVCCYQLKPSRDVFWRSNGCTAGIDSCHFTCIETAATSANRPVFSQEQ